MTTKTTKSNGNNRPKFTVYQVNDQGEDTIWTPLGAAWPHKDGKGFNVQLDLLPVGFDGKLTIRERKDDNAKQEGAGA